MPRQSSIAKITPPRLQNVLLRKRLFDLLDELKAAHAVVIIVPGGCDVGLVTSYDAAEFLRSRTEDLMRVEDIESMIKDFIRYAYAQDNDEADESRLASTVTRVSNPCASIYSPTT